MFRTLVDAATLRERLDDPSWVVVDCRHALADFDAGRHAYEASHIPGAFFASIEDDLAGAKTGKNGRHPFPERDAFVAFLRSMGVNDDTQLVAYDGGADMFAARFWLLARWVGKGAVAVLDGGFNAWTAAGFPVNATPGTARAPGTFAPAEPIDEIIDAGGIAALSGALLLDARAPERFSGESEPIDPVGGHIPGAANRFFKQNYDERGFWKSAERLAAEFGAHGNPQNIVHYCGSGVSAAVNLLALEIVGLQSGRIYPGGWSEYCACGK